MKKIIDVVNLNADASCLSTKWWLSMLQGGKSSYFCKWLKVYAAAGKKISLGVTGATVADIAGFNPEAIDLINSNRDVFEIIIRPFAHDIALLRTTAGFRKNLEAGLRTLEKEFKTVTPYFLPPEFMLTNEQVKILGEYGIEGTFINAGRFKKEIQERLPEEPYMVKGIFGAQLKCIPFESRLTHLYLKSIHYFNAADWNAHILSHPADRNLYIWRDGESSFFVPDGNTREESWLKDEDAGIERVFIREAEEQLNYRLNRNLKEKHYHHYPVHSFMAWMKESRMLGYLMQVAENEKRLPELDKQQQAVWMQVINSDILSAIEKDSPVIRIRKDLDSLKEIEHTIWRSERGMEGEEWLNVLNYGFQNEQVKSYLGAGKPGAGLKLSNRLRYLEAIL